MTLTQTSTVAEAAVELDKMMPDWYYRIDLNILNLYSPSKCVLGQLYDGFGNAPDALTKDSNGGWIDLWNMREKYQDLWKNEITNRRRGAVPTGQQNETVPTGQQNETKREVMNRWAAALEKIYDDKTAGDYTFLGVLGCFVTEYKKAQS